MTCFVTISHPRTGMTFDDFDSLFLDCPSVRDSSWSCDVPARFNLHFGTIVSFLQFEVAFLTNF